MLKNLMFFLIANAGFDDKNSAFLLILTNFGAITIYISIS